MWYRLYAYSWNVDQGAIASWLKENTYRTVKVKRLHENGFSMAVLQYKFRNHRDAALFRMFHQETVTEKLTNTSSEWNSKYKNQSIRLLNSGFFKTSSLNLYGSGGGGKSNFVLSQAKNRYAHVPGGFVLDHESTYSLNYRNIFFIGKYKQKKQKHRKAIRSSG